MDDQYYGPAEIRQFCLHQKQSGYLAKMWPTLETTHWFSEGISQPLIFRTKGGTCRRTIFRQHPQSNHFVSVPFSHPLLHFGAVTGLCFYQTKEILFHIGPLGRSE